MTQDESRALAAIARSTAETAKAVKEIRNLIAGLIVFCGILAVIMAILM